MFDKVDVEEMISLGEQAVLEVENQIEAIFNVTNRLYRWLKPVNPPGILISDIYDDSSVLND
jgi:hypothetical protein